MLFLALRVFCFSPTRTQSLRNLLNITQRVSPKSTGIRFSPSPTSPGGKKLPQPLTLHMVVMDKTTNKSKLQGKL